MGLYWGHNGTGAVFRDMMGLYSRTRWDCMQGHNEAVCREPFTRTGQLYIDSSIKLQRGITEDIWEQVLTISRDWLPLNIKVSLASHS